MQRQIERQVDGRVRDQLRELDARAMARAIRQKADPVEVARLAAAENDCCRWASFSLTIDASGLSLEVTGPAEARPAIESMLGVAS